MCTVATQIDGGSAYSFAPSGGVIKRRMAMLSQENQHMLSEIVLGLLDFAERFCVGAIRLVFATDGLCVRAVRALVFTPIRSVLEMLLPLPPVSAPRPFAVAEGAMAPPEAAPPSSVPLAGFLVASSMSPARSTGPCPNPDQRSLTFP